MPVLNKLSLARKQLRQIPLKKSGWNGFAKYAYFELQDFLNPIMDIFDELSMIGTVSFDSDDAVLTITDLEDNSSVEFTSPMANAEIKGCSPVQNLGGSITYLRRYLWVNAMEILEQDPSEATTGKKGTGPTIPSRPTNQELQISPDAETFLRNELIPYLVDCVKSGDISGANDAIRDANLDENEQIAMFNMMDSATRAFLKGKK